MWVHVLHYGACKFLFSHYSNLPLHTCYSMYMVACVDFTVDSQIAALSKEKGGEMSILHVNFYPRSSRPDSFHSRHSPFPRRLEADQIFDQPQVWITHLQKLSRTRVLKIGKH